MGRSVYTVSDAEDVIFFPYDMDEEWDWGILKNELRDIFYAVDDSFQYADEWESREGYRLVKGPIASAVLSEYCGLCAISIVANDEPSDEVWNKVHSVWDDFAAEWIDKKSNDVSERMKDAGFDLMRRVGRFSNGQSVYERLS